MLDQEDGDVAFLKGFLEGAVGEAILGKYAAALTEYGEQVRARAIERIGPATPDAPLDTEFVKGYRLCLRECIDRLRALPVHCAAEPPKGEVG